jgi:hypothetical protein
MTIVKTQIWIFVLQRNCAFGDKVPVSVVQWMARQTFPSQCECIVMALQKNVCVWNSQENVFGWKKQVESRHWWSCCIVSFWLQKINLSFQYLNVE